MPTVQTKGRFTVVTVSGTTDSDSWSDELSEATHESTLKSDLQDPVQRPVPPELICPISHEIMHDPVRASDGKAYSLRALQTAAQDPMQRGMLDPKILAWAAPKVISDVNLLSQVQLFESGNPFVTSEVSDNELPRHLVCPITGEAFQDPVVAPDGGTYDLEPLLQYVQTYKSLPFGQLPSDSRLIRNTTVSQQLGEVWSHDHLDATLKKSRTVDLSAMLKGRSPKSQQQPSDSDNPFR